MKPTNTDEQTFWDMAYNAALPVFIAQGYNTEDACRLATESANLSLGFRYRNCKE